MVRLDLLVYFTVSCSLVSGQSPYYGLKGLKVNLKPQVTSRLPDEILWKHNGNKVIEFDGKQDHVYGLFKNRVTLDRVSAELNISDLRYEDSGEYAVETFTNKAFDRKTYKLEVIDKVAKPTISCQKDDGSFSTTHGNQATLSCSAESRQPQHLQYEWISHGTVQPGQKLTITLNDDNEEYSCRVSNPLTSETTKFTTKDCNSDESSSRAWIAGPIFAVILVIVVIVAVIIWCMRKQKGSNKRRTQTEESNHFLHPPDKDSHPKPEYLTELVAHLEKKHASQFKKNCGTQPPVKDTSKGLDKPSSAEGLNKVPGINKEDADADQHKEPDSSASEKTPQPEPVPDELKKKGDKAEEAKSPPADRPVPKPRSRLSNALLKTLP
ncbi:uncharacterized protein LOC113172810 [Anabas testudineus]|uniref:uncharacterized protein LOC113172810 n=1 Tax=Anabas testudineus TaxID=64144 RepID=UPI000E45A002|nr:uncharacterized protein LOC113172810 [Anabas testudineus]